MSENNQIDVLSKKVGLAPAKYFYRSSGTDYEFGSLEMYRIFNVNFTDQTTMTKFFSSEHGINVLLKILTSAPFKLINNRLVGSPEYVQQIQTFFEKIRGFFVVITGDVSKSSIHEKYYNKIGEMSKKRDSDNTMLIPEVAQQYNVLFTVLTKTTEMQISDASLARMSGGTIESAKQEIFVSVRPNEISKTFLSPVNQTVFEDIRKYCNDYLGEGKNISSDDDGMNTKKLYEDAMLGLQYLANFDFTHFKNVGYIEDSEDEESEDEDSESDDEDTKKPKKGPRKTTPQKEKNSIERLRLRPNEMSDVIAFLKFILTYPLAMFSFVKFYPFLAPETGPIEDFETFAQIFSSPKVVFVFPRDATNYFGGTIRAGTSIGSESQIMRCVNVKRSNKNPSGPIVNINIKTVKAIMGIFSQVTVLFDTKKKEESAKAIFDLVIKGKLGDVKSDIGGAEGKDAWQEEFIERVDNMESIVLVGDTSGGKTAISLYAMRKLFKKLRDNSDVRILYIAPTDPLANQQFANMVKQFYENQQYIGICSESIVDIPPTTKLLIGTPREVRNYLYCPQIRGLYNEDTISTEFASALMNPLINNTNILFVDEIQTMSLTYAQEDSIEQQMVCKAIEEIISTVQWNPGNNSRVIGMSATLSDLSIENLKRRIQTLTGIPEIATVRYTFNDIGYKRGQDRSRFVPIMRVQERFPIKYISGNINRYSDHEPIVQQDLDAEFIENLIRKAAADRTLPFGIFGGSELDTIELFQMFVSYIDMKANSCYYWTRLRNDYNASIENSGFESIIKNKQNWLQLISDDIFRVSTMPSIGNNVMMRDFDRLIDAFNETSPSKLSKDSIILSPELFGLLYEYLIISRGDRGFKRDTHPYYTFGNVNNTSNFFNLETSDRKDTVFKKILEAQDASPSGNAGNIIPLLLTGIKYGIGLLTSSIPYGFQCEIFKFINVRTKELGTLSPLPIIFCDYGMAAGVNVAFLSGLIAFRYLTEITVSIYLQIKGRFGRRGVGSDVIPIVYLYNVANAHNLQHLETLTFVNTQSSNFFDENEVYTYLLRLIMKFEFNKDNIRDKMITCIDTIISGDSFKDISETRYPLRVRRIHLARYQIRELYDRCRHIIPTICDNVLRPLYYFLQAAEFFELNVQAVSR